MRKEFVMRGKTASTLGLNTEILNFSGFKPGMAYRLVEFQIYPSTNLYQTSIELVGAITAGKTAAEPDNPDFSDDGLIACASLSYSDTSAGYPLQGATVINDTFLITQNLILSVGDKGGSTTPVNWQCKFERVKMTGPEEAVTNYKQFAISDE